MATISEALRIAAQHHRGGRLQVAEEIYRRILAIEPEHADALHRMGVVAHQLGKHEAAIAHLERAIRLKGPQVGFHNSLAEVYRALGRTAEAVAACRRALELEPGNAQTHNNLGLALQDQGNLTEAAGCYRRALELKPDYADAHNNLGTALLDQGNVAEAVACYRRVLELKPDYAETHYNLGTALKDLGRLDEAIACYGRALRLRPEYVEALNNLGNAFRERGQPDEALACFRRALELKPDYAEAHNNLGTALEDLGRQAEAMACFRRALELKPKYATAHYNLGNAWKDQGRLDEAIACYRRALELKPDYAEAHSNLLYTFHFCPGYDAKAIGEEHRGWDRQFAAPLACSIEPHANERATGRRLRIGYVSPDFRDHVVGRNLLPLLREHDRQQFDIVCYADVLRPDAITERFRGYAGVWRNVAGMRHEAIAGLIRQDRIDILVDTTLHMARNRLLVFARKPAPVQVTFAGYPGTTGLAAIDYRLTDPHLDPVDSAAQDYTEESIRLPDSFWCYDPLAGESAVNRLPALELGRLTFGCLSNFCKIHEAVLCLWAKVLRGIDRSRLILSVPEATARGRILAVLDREGVASDRVQLVGLLPRPQYLELYQGIDIGLDTFPYNGHTTSLDSLWMGVPVVSLRGQTAVGRGGLSILTNVGLPELVARDADDYVRIAAELAGDLPRLAALRATLRQRMQNSPLMDAPRFARNVEAAYREMWRRWCREERKGSSDSLKGELERADDL